MEYDEKKVKPASTRALLRQHVEEQSDLCDLVVKHGLWYKRYHACVLCASPFVQAMIRHNFNEKTNGVLELNLGSPESIDMAIMFLYGKSPKLTMENVSGVIHLAEFLLIPNLKALCVKWIKETNVSEENVEKLLHLTSLFDFEMATLTEYIRQHLIELLEGNQLLTITADTLVTIVSDETLSFLTADITLGFLMKWVEYFPEHRKTKLGDILSYIELTNVNSSMKERAKEDQNFEAFRSLFETVSGNENTETMQNVLVTQKAHVCGEFWLFDLGRERWFRIETSADRMFDKVFPSTINESTLCLVESSYNKCTIRLHDFTADQFSCTSLLLTNCHDEISQKIDDIFISGKHCYVVSVHSVKFTRKEEEQVRMKIANEQRLRLMSMFGGPITMMDCLGMVAGVHTYSVRKSTLFSGALSEDGEQTMLTPLFSLNISFGVKVVVNDAKLLALFSENDNYFCIYDEISCTMKKMELKISYNDEVSPYKDGFAIYNRKKIMYISSSKGPLIERKLRVYETVICDDGSRSFDKFAITGNRWLRFRRVYGKQSEVHLDYTFDELGRKNPNDAEWKQIPLPGNSIDDSIVSGVQGIAIPRSKLKCHVECPHCVRIKEGRRNTRRNAEKSRSRDWSTDDDDSDDDVVVGGYPRNYFYDNDDYYYYSSD
ncbi:uncharacterized protein LOC128242622 [Mya arenaria]|uniref:uncharacterized protein LOC128242622 n=1 Tax=Mya arenaria TaxID=6604 RepID=UPI0022E13C72|nr:uncharacterized protein LOC128242622 [Mya arenaria]XP_052815802.1 uncharacterized protein LOC128242622 [Mya arenaria]